MKIQNSEQGSLNILMIPLILAVLMLLGAIGFGAWAYTERQSYKNDVDQKIGAAVEVATDLTKSEKDNEFLQREKEPLKTYVSPGQYGSFTLKYPKTWSGYFTDQNNQLSLILQPDVISSNPKTAYSLKAEVVNQSYAQVVSQSEALIKQGRLKAVAYRLPKVPDVIGLRVDGQISVDKTGAAVYLPLRDKTIKLSAESNESVPDFNSIILANFEFRP